MNLKRFCLVLSLLLVSTLQVQAGALEKAINLSGRQRMLTQKMSKEAVLVALNLNKEANLANLKKTRDLFDTTLAGLKNGDASVGLEKTTNTAILTQLGVVKGLWDKFKVQVDAIINNKAASKAQITEIASQNIPLLKEMNKAVKLWEGLASDTGMAPHLATAINLSGRQRMLTQKMSKEYFLAAYGLEADNNKSNLTATATLFDTTLEGLVNGNDGMGLKATTDLNLVIQLGKVRTMWKKLKPIIEAAANPANMASSIIKRNTVQI